MHITSRKVGGHPCSIFFGSMLFSIWDGQIYITRAIIRPHASPHLVKNRALHAVSLCYMQNECTEMIFCLAMTLLTLILTVTLILTITLTRGWKIAWSRSNYLSMWMENIYIIFWVTCLSMILMPMHMGMSIQ